MLGWTWVLLAGGCTLYFVGMSSLAFLKAPQPGAPLTDEARFDAAWSPIIFVGALVFGGAGGGAGVVILRGGHVLRNERHKNG